MNLQRVLLVIVNIFIFTEWKHRSQPPSINERFFFQKLAGITSNAILCTPFSSTWYVVLPATGNHVSAIISMTAMDIFVSVFIWFIASICSTILSSCSEMFGHCPNYRGLDKLCCKYNCLFTFVTEHYVAFAIQADIRFYRDRSRIKWQGANYESEASVSRVRRLRHLRFVYRRMSRIYGRLCAPSLTRPFPYSSLDRTHFRACFGETEPF